jgi:hypothetical protein
VDAEVFQAKGTAERDPALVMWEQVLGMKAVTVGGDGFNARDLVKECRHMVIVPQVAQHHARPGSSAVDGRTPWHGQKTRKRIEECFGWLKTIAMLRKVRHRGVGEVHWILTFA